PPPRPTLPYTTLFRSPRANGPGPRPLGPRARPDSSVHGAPAGDHGDRDDGLQARCCDPQVLPAGGAVPLAGWLRGQRRSRPHLRRAGTAGTSARPAAEDPLGWTAPPRGASPDPLRRHGRLRAIKDHTAARRD